MKRHLAALLRDAAARAIAAGDLALPAVPAFTVDVPADPSFGELTTDLAMVAARQARTAPGAVADAVLRHLVDGGGWVAATEVAGPGYVNFRFTAGFWQALLREAIAAGAAYGRTPGNGRPACVRCALAGWGGALSIDAVRGAVVADAVANVLDATGWQVERVYVVAADDVGTAAELERWRVRVDAFVGPDRLWSPAGGAPVRVHVGADRVVPVGPVRPVRNGAPICVPDDAAAVLDEVGVDAARFFLLRRPAAGPADLDLALARQGSTDSPLVYVRYAHVRAASVPVADVGDPTPLADADLDLVRTIVAWPDVVDAAARDFAPDGVVSYAVALAGAFHRYYNRIWIPTDDPAFTQGRRALVHCVQHVLHGALGLVGIGAPERM